MGISCVGETGIDFDCPEIRDNESLAKNVTFDKCILDDGKWLFNKKVRSISGSVVFRIKVEVDKGVVQVYKKKKEKKKVEMREERE